MNQAFSIDPIDQAMRVLERFALLGAPEPAQGGLRIVVKPNLTWPEPRAGVTATVAAIRGVVRELTGAGNRVWIAESDGGYGTNGADEAFDGHGLREVARETGSELIDLSSQPTARLLAGGVALDMPRVLLEDTDLIINMPVPKVHVMTRYTGAVKNQWGLIRPT